MDTKQQDFIEGLGMVFDALGVVPMAGRIYAALLLSPDTLLTAEDLAESLQASRGAVSQGTRTLMGMRLIVKTRRPGDRKDYFRVRANGWPRATMNKQAEIDHMRDLFRLGLESLESPSPAARASLEENILFLDFWHDRLASFATEWNEYKEAHRAQRDPGN